MVNREAASVQQALEEQGLSQYHATLWGDAARRLLTNKLAVIGLVLVLGIAFMAIFANQLMPHPYAKIYFGSAQLPPSHTFPFGTDIDGRDNLSRLIYASRVSMSVGMFTAGMTLVFGVIVGAIAGFYGGAVDNYIMRIVDIVYTLPSLLLAIALMERFGQGLWQLCIAVGVVSWPTLARLVRGQFLSLREKEFVKAATVAGTSDFKIILRHLLPNSLTPIIVTITFAVPAAIFTEASLSFVGVGINPPTPDWGQMAGGYAQYLQSSPWMSIPPTIMIAVAFLAFTFLGDGLRDALDPRMNK